MLSYANPSIDWLRQLGVLQHIYENYIKIGLSWLYRPCM